MKARVIFVGLHNKPGMRPLDSRTKSGKLILRIISKCEAANIETLRTNLFDTDELPDREFMASLSFDWIERVKPTRHDIIVLLGAMTHKWFQNLLFDGEPIKVAHPASMRSHAEMDGYVDRTFELIKKAYKQ